MAESRDLTEHERNLIEWLIRKGITDGQQEALDQLALARYGGPSHGEGSHVCMLIDIPSGLSPIPGDENRIFEAGIEPHGKVLMGDIELWVHRGKLAGLDLSQVDDASNSQWPAVEYLQEPVTLRE